MSSEAARILDFWQAVEIFSPPEVPHADGNQDVRTVGEGEPAPWEPGHQLKGVDLEPGRVWRHVVYGGVFQLSGLLEVLRRRFGRDIEVDVDDRGGRRESAIFACTVDQTGVLIERSMVLSACAWAAGACAKAGQPLAQLPDFYTDALTCANALGTLADAMTGSGGRLLAASMKNAVPAAIGAAVTAAFAPAFAPVGAVVAQAAGTFLGKVAEGVTKSTVSDENGSPAAENQAPVRLASRPLTAEDLIEFVKGLSRGLNVSDVLRPSGLRVKSYRVAADRADIQDGTGFLNSLLAEDLAHVADALRRGDAGTGLRSYLSSDSQAASASRIDVREAPWTVVDGVAPARTPRGRWVTATDRPLTLSQQFAVNEIMANLAGRTGIFAVNGPPGTGKTTILTSSQQSSSTGLSS